MTMTNPKLPVLLVLAILASSVGLWTALRMQAGESAQPPARNDDAALIKRGDYIVNKVARCGGCHTPRTDKGEMDMTKHLQGAPIWFTPKIKPQGDWETHASDITASGRAGLWSADKLTKYLSTGEKSDPPMPTYFLTTDDARAVTAYLRSLPGKKKT